MITFSRTRTNWSIHPRTAASARLARVALAGAALGLALLAGAGAVAAEPQADGAATAHPALWPRAHSPAAITDAATERRIARIMARMTLEQKVGQVIQGDISTITPADLAHYPLGSILAGGNSGPFGDERADAATWDRMVRGYLDASRTSGAGIPILFGVDAVHGHSNLPGATIFPHNIGLGAAHDAALVQRIGAATAAEIAGSGIAWTFAPTLAVPQDLRWGRSYEGYSADPALVAAYGGAMVRGLQGPLKPGVAVDARHVAATAKHFLADGGTEGGKDQGDARIPEATLIARHAQGYPAAIDAGALTVMASFSSWNGVKNHGNRSLLTGVLKDRMGFAGLVVGDWNGHGQVAGCSVVDCPQAINAGLDLYMASDSWKGLFDNTLREVRSGVIPTARLDDAVRRILRVKAKLGLLGGHPVVRSDHAALGAPAHLALAREAVAKSLVLLKNDNAALPVRPGARVLITGPGADDMAMQAGGWTITWQGTDTTAADFPKGQTVGHALADAIIAAGGSARIDPKGDGAGFTPDVVIAVYGERPYAEFQGDVPDLAYRPLGNEREVLGAWRAKGAKVVSLFLSGRPLFTGPEINASDAFVAAWLPGTQAAGIGDVLVAGRDGRTTRDFTGTLPFPWPADARSPVAQALFPMGYGLSYKAHAAGPTGRVNEDPRVTVTIANDNQWIRAGKVLDPWHLSAAPGIAIKAVDLTAQEDAKRLAWGEPGTLQIDGPPTSFARQLDEGFVVRIDWQIDDAGKGPVRQAFAGTTLDLTAMIAAAPRGKVWSMRVPLRCFADAGAQVGAVTQPLQLSAPAGFVATLRSVSIEGTGDMIACPPKG